MESKIRVYGKAQGWTALGIVDAYLKIHPHATLDDLNKAFPREKFASAKSIDHLFIDMKTFEKEAHESGNERAIADAENLRRIHWYITLEDGTDVMFYKIAWGKTSFPLLVEHAKQYGIEVASFEDIGRGKGRGSYEIEYIGGDADHADSEAERVDTPTFKTVKIGSQVWMAENLALTKDRDGNELVLGKDYFYPGNDEKNVEKYGLLYTWEAAMRIAPKGWHLPSDNEWEKLEKVVENIYNCSGCSGLLLSSRRGWPKMAGTWDFEEYKGVVGLSGFEAMPAGSKFSNKINDKAYYWTSDHRRDNDTTEGLAVYITLDMSQVQRINMSVRNGVSVRLVKDED